MKNEKLFEGVRFYLGNEILLDNIFKALNADKLNEIIEYIARCYDILDILKEGEKEDE